MTSTVETASPVTVILTGPPAVLIVPLIKVTPTELTPVTLLPSTCT